MASVLVTGGGRGLGLGLVRLLASLPVSTISKVFVTTRGKPSEDLTKIIETSGGRVINVECEVVDTASVKRAAAEVEGKLGGEGLDILINNAAMSGLYPQGIRNMAAEEMLQEFNVNVASTHRVTAAFIPLLQKGKQKKIAMVSSSAGSISWANRYSFSPAYAYKITKAAMNMMAVQYAIEYEKYGFTFLTLSPGWLKTTMGGDMADLDVETGAKATWDIVNKADKSYNGKFYNIHVPGWEHNEGVNQYDGLEIPW
ncbi:hypothetical protein N5P37_007651 [Trichoderma harzianum]|uniref:Uncharacterized protein n=1 Tax=Trichoderma harzianum CBS 226.95 TaxID=983964 RepID=A0A2T4A4J7_TRIHA|nr:hypothetical protein M431DRAFT_8285 [Trichoderma harzianum CBS 226.95]KAK0759463.1 hypothetical protein N5P37_007651 [Trichoderma harzianum]PKK43624.1 hypothetical protein CI102_10733 [Trichoderma harzianum]PTB51989.1 hypothetical protein M431DRAFT_8285 [Trichoderma harzianum CBS 226.95]